MRSGLEILNWRGDRDLLRGAACSQSIEAAKKLTELGYTNVRACREGLEGWKAAGDEIVAPTPGPAA